MMSKALGIIRLSKSPDPASTSVERQREIIEHYCEQQGYVLLDCAEDLAVSAFKVHPMKRKQLRAWLNDERAEDYDVIVYWRQDRVVRQPEDFLDMVRWARDHRKALESATEGTGDVTQHANMLIGFIGAWQASGESRSTSARVKSSYEKLKSDGRYPGGRKLYGLKSVARTDGPGFELVPDIGTAKIIKEAARRVIAGESVNAIVADFNHRGIRASDGGTWWAYSLRRNLQNPKLIGNIISADDFGRLQDAIEERGRNRTVRTLGRDSLILDLVFCGNCGTKVYRTKNRNRYVARCRNYIKRWEVANPCDWRSVPLAFLEDAIERDVLKHGDWLIEEKVTHAARKLRLDEITRELLSLHPDYASHRITREEMLSRQAKLLDEQEQIEASAGTAEWEPAGETVRQRWERLSAADRRLWLLRIGTTYATRYEVRERDGGHEARWKLESSWRDPGDDTHRERVVRP